MAGQPDNQTTVNGNNDSQFRFNLAKWIVFFVFGGTALIGITAIFAAARWRSPGESGFGAVKDILGILLPVLSAWAGTVFAFYFGRENFEAAARSSAALVRQLTPEEKLRSTIFKDAMIPIEKAATLNLVKPESEIKLEADMIVAILDKEKRERLPMLKDGRIKFIAHRSLIDKFIVQATTASPPKNAADLSLQDMLDDPDTKKVLTAFRTVVATASLAEVKVIMDNIENCSDVFATEDGRPDTKVIGWVTNVIVRQQATV